MDAGGNRLFFLLAFLLGGPAQASPAHPAGAFGPVLGTGDREVLQREAAAMLPSISRLSGLPVLYPVGVRIGDADSFRAHYARELGPFSREDQGLVLTLLGLMRPGEDPASLALAGLMEGVEGFYDPKTQDVVLADWVPLDRQGPILAHELVHALQDQSFSLPGFLASHPGEGQDGAWARQALVEGQAVEVARLYEGERGGGDPGVTGNFAYDEGAAFWRECGRLHPELVPTDIFLAPPTTTREILHPTAFGLSPGPVGDPRMDDLGSGPLKSCRKIWDDHWGEYGWGLILGRYGAPTASLKDWRWDRLEVFGDGAKGHSLLVAEVVLKDGPSAQAFFESYRWLLSRKYEARRRTASGPGVEGFETEPSGLEVRVERSGERVLILEGTDPSDGSVLRDLLLKGNAGRR